MTIQEAIKSGKPFKRSFWRSWIIAVGYIGIVRYEETSTAVTFSSDDLLADDWQVRE